MSPSPDEDADFSLSSPSVFHGMTAVMYKSLVDQGTVDPSEINLLYCK